MTWRLSRKATPEAHQEKTKRKPLKICLQFGSCSRAAKSGLCRVSMVPEDGALEAAPPNAGGVPVWVFWLSPKAEEASRPPWWGSPSSKLPSRGHVGRL